MSWSWWTCPSSSASVICDLKHLANLLCAAQHSNKYDLHCPLFTGIKWREWEIQGRTWCQKGNKSWLWETVWSHTVSIPIGQSWKATMVPVHRDETNSSPLHTHTHITPEFSGRRQRYSNLRDSRCLLGSRPCLQARPAPLKVGVGLETS